MRSMARQTRHKKLMELIKSDPFMSDSELAGALQVSVPTIRLDRTLLNLPELRERTRLMAEKASRSLRSMKQEEVMGELLELEPNRWALSVLISGRECAFRDTNIIGDHNIYAQASTLAIAVISAEMVVVGAARLSYIEPAFVGERLLARAKVGTHKGNKYVVSVHTKAGDREIFVARFVVASLDSAGADKYYSDRGAI